MREIQGHPRLSMNLRNVRSCHHTPAAVVAERRDIDATLLHCIDPAAAISIQISNEAYVVSAFAARQRLQYLILRRAPLRRHDIAESGLAGLGGGGVIGRYVKIEMRKEKARNLIELPRIVG